MNIDCCKSYVGKQIIGLLPSEQECLYYLVINSQDLGAANFVGWTIDGVDVELSGYENYGNNLGGQSLIISYIGTQPSTVTLDDGFGNLYPFDVTKVTEFGGSCDNVCYQAEFDYGYILYYIDFFQLGGATPTASAPINIDDEAILESYINALLGTTNADVTSIWNGSRYVVTINNAYNLGGLVFEDGFGNLTTFNVLPCQITPPNPVPLTLLTLYPGATAGYSVRKLSSTYSGSALRVRRSSDNTEQDIGFDGLNLDIAALANFVGPGNGFVTKWYDQSGNGNTGNQTVANNQPRIVNLGSIEIQSGKPTLQYLGNNFFNLTNTLSITASWSVFQTLGRANTGISMAGFGSNNVSGYTSLFFGNDLYYWDSSNGKKINAGILTNLKLITVYNGSSTAYVNNISQTTTNTQPGSNNNFTLIGKTGGANSNGYISEIIYYPTSQLSNNTGINTNITTYYSI